MRDHLSVVCDRWSILILFAAISGSSHFEDFYVRLGIARNILADRLSKLAAAGILCRQVSRTDGRKIEYRLTDKGQSLSPILNALSEWVHSASGDSCPLPAQSDIGSDSLKAAISLTSGVTDQ